MRVSKLALLFLSGVILASCGTDSTPSLYDVQVSVSPGEGGTIAPTTDSTLEAGQQITLSAQSAEGYRFVNWSGDIDSTANPLSITVDQDYSLTANFEKKSYELTVNTDGDGMVSEQIIPARSTAYEHGTVVELTANPAEGWEFVEWLGDLSGGDNPEQITVDEAKEVTAVFEQVYTLTINTSGEGAVSTEPDQTEFTAETTVTLTANPAEGWIFDRWVGAEPATDNPLKLTVSDDTEVTAVFEESNPTDDGVYTVDLTVQGEGNVSQSLFDGKKIGEGYAYNSEVIIQAEPADGWLFDHWEGDTDMIDKNDDREVITLREDFQAVAVMIKIPFPSGDGSSHRPYEIATLEHLKLAKKFQTKNGTDDDSHFIQTANIDASATANWNGGKGLEPFRVSDYDGQGHTISNLTINRGEQYVALFKGCEGTIEDLKIENINITSRGRYTAGVYAGRNGDCSIKNMRVSGTIVQKESSHWRPDQTFVGGIIGYSNNSYLSGIQSEVNITAESDHVGGAAGYVSSAYPSGNIQGLNNVTYTGSVSGRNKVGGLVGFSKTGDIDESYASGTVTGMQDVGGLIGMYGSQYDYFTLSEVYSVANVSGDKNVGGLIGKSVVALQNVYARGNVEGNTNVGGVVGKHVVDRRSSSNDNFLFAYATGQVSGDTSVGGVIGLIEYTTERSRVIDANYWDIETTNQTEGVGSGNENSFEFTGLTTSQMTGNSAKNNMPEFDFSEIWKTTIGYPIFYWQEE